MSRDRSKHGKLKDSSDNVVNQQMSTDKISDISLAKLVVQN